MSRRIASFLTLVTLLGCSPAFAQSTGELFTGFQAKSTDPVQVDADKLEIFEQGKQRISVFTGGVTVTRGQTVMKASSIKLYSDLAQKAVKTDAFSRIEASGPVTVDSGVQRVTGDNAVVDMKAQTIVLEGNVVLTQGKEVATGHKLVVNLKTGSARIEQAPGKKIRIIVSPDDAKAQAQSQ